MNEYSQIEFADEAVAWKVCETCAISQVGAPGGPFKPTCMHLHVGGSYFTQTIGRSGSSERTRLVLYGQVLVEPL